MMNAFIPTMPHDDAPEVLGAILDGRPYECPNGHRYVIIDCGRPNEKSNCPTCRLAIGGVSMHVLAANNREVSREDRSSTGHILGPTQALQQNVTQRNLNPLCCGVLRCLTHVAMLLGTEQNIQQPGICSGKPHAQGFSLNKLEAGKNYRSEFWNTSVAKNIHKSRNGKFAEKRTTGVEQHHQGGKVWSCASIFDIKCNLCGKINKIKTSSEHRSGKRGRLTYNNSRAVLGSLHAGIGNTHLSNLVATMNLIPTMNNKTFKSREREVGKAVESLAQTSCKTNMEVEKKMAEKNREVADENGLIGIPVSYHMGWQKRGKGQLADWTRVAMGMQTGCVLAYTTTCKSCRVCVHAREKGKNQGDMTAEKIMMGHRKQWNQQLRVNCGIQPPPKTPDSPYLCR
ncbi:Hypothetical predicted protein [Paramuricea clavata]|uniref:Uncharacterized protein n=2 Tax=Paramuricea clavata TaxID=317549 RepID=A0A7D9IP55_PARCT|nr:Hypothetical predicted protein [Paramuricea clavata]